MQYLVFNFGSEMTCYTWFIIMLSFDVKMHEVFKYTVHWVLFPSINYMYVGDKKTKISSVTSNASKSLIR